MIPIRKKSFYEYVFRIFYKEGGKAYKGYRYTINGRVYSHQKYFDIKLLRGRNHFFAESKDFKMKNGNHCYEVVYYTERHIKEY